MKATALLQTNHLAALKQIVDLEGEDLEVKSWVKDRVRFKTVNIVEPPVEEVRYDYIICRNVLIYFESSSVAKIVSNLSARLADSGHFCVGVSETSALIRDGFKAIGGATYTSIKKAAAPAASERPSRTSLKTLSNRQILT